MGWEKPLFPSWTMSDKQRGGAEKKRQGGKALQGQVFGGRTRIGEKNGDVVLSL